METSAWRIRLCQTIVHLENILIQQLLNPWHHHNASRVLSSTIVRTGESLLRNSPFLVLMFAPMVTFVSVVQFTTPTWTDQQSSSALLADTAQAVLSRQVRRQKTCVK